MLFKLSNLNSKLALTLGYNNPALNNSVLLNKLKAMLRVLPITFKPVNNLICCKTVLIWVVKRATSLFHSALFHYKLHDFCYPFSRTFSIHFSYSASGNLGKGPSKASVSGKLQKASLWGTLCTSLG